MPKPQRDQIINTAIKAGKIPATDRDKYARNYDASPQAYRHLLTAAVENGGLAAGVHKNEGAPGAEEYDTQWLSPRERERVAAVRAAAPKPGSRLAGAPTQEIGRGDLDGYDASRLTPAERAAIEAAQAAKRGVEPGLIAGDAIGGRPPQGRES